MTKIRDYGSAKEHKKYIDMTGSTNGRTSREIIQFKVFSTTKSSQPQSKRVRDFSQPDLQKID